MIGEDVDQAYLKELATVNLNSRLINKNADQIKIIYTPIHGAGKVLYDRAFRQAGFKNIIPVVSQSIIDPEFLQQLSQILNLSNALMKVLS